MEIEEVKKITRYDNYTINEFVRGLVKTREDIKTAKAELATRADEVSKRLQDVKTEITDEELLQAEEEIESIKDEKRKNEIILEKWEQEKERISAKLANKKEDAENKILEHQKKKQDLENEIQENTEKMQNLIPDSKEYEELEKANKAIRKKISYIKGNITRNEKRKDNLIKIIENFENENVLEGIEPPKTIERAITKSGKNIRNLKKEEEQKKISKPEKEELSQTDLEIKNLEEQIKKSAERMREYKESGNYEQEVAEHAYYNELISKLNGLKTKETEEKKISQSAQTEHSTKIEATVKAKTEQPVKTQTTVKAKTEQPVKTQATVKAQIAKPGVTIESKADQLSKTENIVIKRSQGQTETLKEEKAPKQEIKWNSKLTPEQIEELIAEGIEPGDNEYDLYLWNHGINPFESQIRTKAEPKTEIDAVLQKYLNDGFNKNAFGWYFNPWTSEYDKDYDPHKDPEYNEKVEEKSTQIKEEQKEQEEPKAEKNSVTKKMKGAIEKFLRTIKTYINNFNNKKLAEGQDIEEQAEYIDKANETLNETLANKNVLNQNSRRAMQERNEFVSKVQISDELMKKIDSEETQPKTNKEEKEAER